MQLFGAGDAQSFGVAERSLLDEAGGAPQLDVDMDVDHNGAGSCNVLSIIYFSSAVSDTNATKTQTIYMSRLSTKRMSRKKVQQTSRKMWPGCIGSMRFAR